MKEKLKKCKAQHGDVLFFEEKGKFKNLENVSDGFVVEKGEGVHTHVLKHVTDCKVAKTSEGELVIFPGKKTIIDHEEHGPMPLKEPLRKKIEQEFDYEKMEAYNTRD